MSLSDEAYVIEHMLMIADKEGNDVPFVLNSAQKKLDGNLTGRDLVPKARQEGMSSYVLARYLVKCLNKRNTRAVVISHDQESTQRMLQKVKYYIKNIVGPAPIINNMSANLITFPKMDSMFYIGTAGSRKFGRGDTITDLHCSEYAFWTNPMELMRGLFQAVPKSGEVIIESTGNGLNDYYRRCMRAYEGKSPWGIHFFPWHEFPEYTLDLSTEESDLFMSSLNEELEEPGLVTHLTPGQLAWRRVKLEEMDYDLPSFKQEYPMTLDECFQMSGRSVFHRVNYLPTKRWEKEDTYTWVLEGHPVREMHYCIGADVGAGVGVDSSVIEVICLETMEQVAEYSNNKIDPEHFGRVMADFGRRFNTAFLVPEANNHGILTAAVLEKIYPMNSIYRNSTTSGGTVEDQMTLHRLGYRTSVRNKPLMIGRLRSLLTGELTIHSVLLKTQLSTFIEHENGKLAASEGCHDDTVMAIACAVAGLNTASLRARASKPMLSKAVDPFSVEGMLQELRSDVGNFPIRAQTDWEIN